MIRVAPSLLSADFANLQAEVAKVEKGGADYLHLDVMDGHFVPNLTFGPGLIAALRKHSKLPFDVHLMIENPDLYLGEFAAAGADIITVHAEAVRHLHRTVTAIHQLGKKAGVAINPATPLSMVEWVLHDVDLLLIMSVNPGFGGQKYISASTEKIKTLRAMIDSQNLPILLEVDGGINGQTAVEVAKAGADILVAGSAVFGAEDPATAIQAFKAIKPQPTRI